MSRDPYTYRITWSPEDNEYLAVCPAFPALSCLAPTPEAALLGIRNAVAAIAADQDRDTLRG